MIPQFKTDEMIAHYKNAIEQNPDDSDSYYNLGIILGERGMVEDAVLCYRKAVLDFLVRSS